MIAPTSDSGHLEVSTPEQSNRGLFDGLIGALAWPFIKKHVGHHLERDKRDGVNDNA